MTDFTVLLFKMYIDFEMKLIELCLIEFTACYARQMCVAPLEYNWGLRRGIIALVPLVKMKYDQLAMRGGVFHRLLINPLFFSAQQLIRPATEIDKN